MSKAERWLRPQADRHTLGSSQIIGGQLWMYDDTGKEATSPEDDAGELEDIVSAAAPSRTDTAPEAALYLKELGLNPTTQETALEIDLPLEEKPHLTLQQCQILRKWAAKVERRTLPNGLSDARAADAAQAPVDLESLRPCARVLVKHAVGDLRRKIEEKNVHLLQNGQRSRRAQLAQLLVLKLGRSGGPRLEPAITLAEEAAEAQFGISLDGLCRAVAAFDGVLGSGGPGLLQGARRALREWLRQEEDQQFDLEQAYKCVKDSLPEGLEERRWRLLCAMAVGSIKAVRADLARDRCGEAGEATLASRLQEAGIDRECYFTEEDLRATQLRLFGRVAFGTPDVLFRREVRINGAQPVRWIDSKGTCLLPGFQFSSQVQKLQRQIIKFEELFGEGLVLWRGGFACAATDGLKGVRCASWLSREEEECRPPTEGAVAQGGCGKEASPASVEAWRRWQ